MTWDPRAPQGNEARKVRFDVLPYCRQGFDLGCGPDKVWPHLLGIDSGKDTKLFGIAMKPDVVLPDCTRLTMFADGCTETVFSSHLLEHVEDTVGALREWWRVLRPGGHLILYLPHKDFYPNIGQPGANPDHKHDFLPQDIVDAMTVAAPDWSLLVNQDRNEGQEYSFLQVYRKEDAGKGQHERWKDPKPFKTAGLVRIGGHGDALWASSVLWHLKQQGYHVTVYTAKTGADVLRHDPHIDRLIALPDGVLTDDELMAFWAHEAVKYDRWTNLLGSVENRLLYHQNTSEFFLPHRLRHRFANHNYLEMVHDYADVPHEWHQKYYPLEVERAWAKKMRALLPGPVVVINPAGSGPVKYWPHAQRLMELLAEHKIYSLVLGDVRDDAVLGCEPYGIFVGMEWPVRNALAYALEADVVVATESLIANAVAFEPMLKVITLSHSSRENLTRDWINTATIEPEGLACYPCHRIHPPAYHFCARDTVTKAAACQAKARPEAIADLIVQYLADARAKAA